MWRTQKMDFRAGLPSPSPLSLPGNAITGTGQALVSSPGEQGVGKGLMKSIWGLRGKWIRPLVFQNGTTKKDTWTQSFRKKGRPWFHVPCHMLPKLWSHYFVDVQPDRCCHPTWDGPPHSSPKGPEGKCEVGLGPRVTNSSLCPQDRQPSGVPVAFALPSVLWKKVLVEGLPWWLKW